MYTIRNRKKMEQIYCPECNKQFNGKYAKTSLYRHIRQQHNKEGATKVITLSEKKKAKELAKPFYDRPTTYDNVFDEKDIKMIMKEKRIAGMILTALKLKMNKPQYQNVYLETKKKLKGVKIVKNGVWIYEETDKVIQKVYNEIILYVINMLRDEDNKIKPKYVEEIKNDLTQYYDAQHINRINKQSLGDKWTFKKHGDYLDIYDSIVYRLSLMKKHFDSLKKDE